MALTVQGILNAVFPAYAAARRLPLRIHRAARAIRRCRTAALGAHARRCPQGHVREVRYHSCRHRSCPSCAAPRAARWLDAVRQRLLPTRHFQLVFTIAQELRVLWRYHHKELGDALFVAARQSILALLGDPGRLGVCSGFVPPRGFHVVRAGGLYAGGQSKRLEQARSVLAASVSSCPQAACPPALSEPPPPACPVCRLALVVVPWLSSVAAREATPQAPRPTGKSP